MNRREFLKLLGWLPLAVLAKPKSYEQQLRDNFKRAGATIGYEFVEGPKLPPDFFDDLRPCPADPEAEHEYDEADYIQQEHREWVRWTPPNDVPYATLTTTADIYPYRRIVDGKYQFSIDDVNWLIPDSTQGPWEMP